MGDLRVDERFMEVRDIVQRRRDADAVRIREMIEVRDRYNGDWVVPIPDIEGEEDRAPVVPYLLNQAIDDTAMRAASMLPSVSFPWVTGPGIDVATARAYARDRREFIEYIREESGLRLQLYRLFRHYGGYGSMAQAVVPDFEGKMPRMVTRDALSAYPEPRDPEDLRPPRDCAFLYGMTPDDLIKQFPETAGKVRKHTRGLRGSLWDVFEWIDADEIIIGLLGPRSHGWVAGGVAVEQADLSMPLRRWPNRAGMCTAMVPRRVTLDRVMSQVKQAVPANDLWAKMMTLDAVAAEKAIFADRWMTAREGGTPEIISNDGNWQDGRTGDINLLRDVDKVGVMADGPGPAAQPVIDRTERAVAITAGALPQSWGETPGANLRTARALDSMTSIASDPRIQEIHTVAQMAFRSVHQMVLAVAEGYWPRRRFVCFTGAHTDSETRLFTPAKQGQTGDGGRLHAVRYPFPGLDATQTAVALLQMVAGKMIPVRQARQLHPHVEDSEQAERLIALEQMQEAIRTGYASQVVSGGVQLQDALVAVQAMLAGDSPEDAIQKAQRAAQERQEQAQRARVEAPGSADAQPGLQPEAEAAASPDAMMSLAPVRAPTTAQERLRMLAGAIRA